MIRDKYPPEMTPDMTPDTGLQEQPSEEPHGPSILSIIGEDLSDENNLPGGRAPEKSPDRTIH